MSDSLNIKPVGRVISCFEEKFGVPRQPRLVPSSFGAIELVAPWNTQDAVDGLEAVSHLWVQFGFHLSPPAKSAKVRPPRLGGNRKLGVFASRSPVRPNGLGLSVVKLEALEISPEGVRLRISGHDLVDGTPVYDIKPYLPYADVIAEAVNPIAPAAPSQIPVDGVDVLGLPLHLQQLVFEVLRQDPRPAYQKPDPARVYGMRLAGGNLQWRYLPCERSALGLRIEVVGYTRDHTAGAADA